MVIRRRVSVGAGHNCEIERFGTTHRGVRRWPRFEGFLRVMKVQTLVYSVVNLGSGRLTIVTPLYLLFSKKASKKTTPQKAPKSLMRTPRVDSEMSLSEACRAWVDLSKEHLSSKGWDSSSLSGRLWENENMVMVVG